MAEELDRKQARGRLIDHFKRVYTIVVGLSITEAVKRVVPFQIDDLPLPSIFMFFTFFITIIPIFHGGDRSLDVKYFNGKSASFRTRMSYLWDVYMLLLTAILFVCIAMAIPIRSVDSNGLVEYRGVDIFYKFLTVMLIFDVIVLIIDYWKADNRPDLGPYLIWTSANILFAGICFYVAFCAELNLNLKSNDLVHLYLFSASLTNITFCILVVAVARTIVDYLVGEDFLFP